MKKIIYLFLILCLTIGAVSCQDMESVNTDPNNPVDVPSNMIMAGTEKKIMDYVYDNWFSGRQCTANTGLRETIRKKTVTRFVKVLIITILITYIRVWLI